MNDKINKILDTEDKTSGCTREDVEKNKIFGVLAYLWILFFIPLVVCPDSKFGKFHANQGLVLFLFGIVGSAVIGIITMVFALIGLGIVGVILASIFGLLDVLLVVLGIVNAATGKAKALPIIGGISLIK